MLLLLCTENTGERANVDFAPSWSPESSNSTIEKIERTPDVVRNWTPHSGQSSAIEPGCGSKNGEQKVV
jgi:hypothetical protein